MAATPFNAKDHSRNLLDLLYRIIIDEQGHELCKLEFTDVLLDMLENVAGLEAMSEEETEDLIDKLWRTYRGKN